MSAARRGRESRPRVVNCARVSVVDFGSLVDSRVDSPIFVVVVEGHAPYWP